MGRVGGAAIDVIGRAYRLVLVTLLLVIAALIAVSVFARYALGAPLVYSYELASLLFVWLVFLSLPGGAATGAHLGADILTPYLAPRPLAILRIVSHALSLCVLAYIAWYAWTLAGRTRVVLPTLGLSMAWMYAAVPVGCGLYMGWIVADILALAGLAPPPRARHVDA